MLVRYVCINMVFFFKQKTAYEMRISDWSSDVCSSDLFKGLQRVLRDDDRIRHFTAARQEANAHGKPRLQTSRNIKHSRGGTRLTAKTRRNGTLTSVYRSAVGSLDDGPVAGSTPPGVHWPDGRFDLHFPGVGTAQPLGQTGKRAGRDSGVT